jgi:hypothetical protein
MRLRSIGGMAAAVAAAGLLARAWRWLRSPGWNEGTEAVYGPSDVPPADRVGRAAGAGFLGGGGGPGPV